MPDIKDSLIKAIWSRDLTDMPGWRARGVRALRLIDAIGRDLGSGQLSLRAMSLVYTTLLSLVPLLAVSFSVLKGYGVTDQIEPLMLNFLAPMGDKGVEITEKVIGFVDNMKAGVLGFVGMAFLFYTVVSLLQKIERAFNYTWHVTEERTIGQRFSDYLSVVMVGPVLVFTAIGLTASIMDSTVVNALKSIGPMGQVFHIIARSLPYFFIIGAFTFIYVFVPNTKVKVRSALVGAIVAGILWETIGWAFASIVVASAKYTAIYSALATLIMFMIWLYIGWLILLIGASIAFYYQHPEYLTVRSRKLQPSNRTRERLGMQVMFLLARQYYQQRTPWTVQSLSAFLHTPMDFMTEQIKLLEQGGLIMKTGDAPAGYIPAAPLEQIKLMDIFHIVRCAGDGPFYKPRRVTSASLIENLFDDLEAAAGASLDQSSLRDLVEKDMESTNVTSISEAEAERV
ncbi:MAG: YihY/virulence factor BrkB family protein [Gammaproteobacteria bacterium]|nr:MAG: YihY/virulence factor BrkB family protein [Gammaproteobacteria bacterium]